MSQAQNDEPTFEEIVERMETIAGKLGDDQVKLEEALSLFEEGVALNRNGTRRLDAAERRIESLMEQGRTEPFEPEGSGRSS